MTTTHRRATDVTSPALPPGFAAAPPALRTPVTLVQRWSDLAFLHWAVDPDDVKPLLPAGTRPDVLDGGTYVGLVPFRMTATRAAGRLPVPWAGSFLETNVRLYSVDDDGRHGVVFRSLDAERLLAVLTARATLRLPYVWARMSATSDGDLRTWRASRVGERTSSVVTVRVGRVVVPTVLDVWLTARWGLHTTIAGRTYWLPNEHPPWPLHAAELLALDDGFVRRGGLRVSGPPDVPVRWSPGVRTSFATPVALGR